MGVMKEVKVSKESILNNFFPVKLWVGRCEGGCSCVILFKCSLDSR